MQRWTGIGTRQECIHRGNRIRGSGGHSLAGPDNRHAQAGMTSALLPQVTVNHLLVFVPACHSLILWNHTDSTIVQGIFLFYGFEALNHIRLIFDILVDSLNGFFNSVLSHTGKTIALTLQTFVSKVMSLLFNFLSRFGIALLSKSKHLLIWQLQSPSAVILVTKKRKSVIASAFFSIYLPWSDGTRCHDLNVLNVEL